MTPSPKVGRAGQAKATAWTCIDKMPRLASYHTQALRFTMLRLALIQRE